MAHKVVISLLINQWPDDQIVIFCTLFRFVINFASEIFVLAKKNRRKRKIEKFC